MTTTDRRCWTCRTYPVYPGTPYCTECVQTYRPSGVSTPVWCLWPPPFATDRKLWRAACNEVAAASGEKHPFPSGDTL